MKDNIGEKIEQIKLVSRKAKKKENFDLHQATVI